MGYCGIILYDLRLEMRGKVEKSCVAIEINIICNFTLSTLESSQHRYLSMGT